MITASPMLASVTRSCSACSCSESSARRRSAISCSSCSWRCSDPARGDVQTFAQQADCDPRREIGQQGNQVGRVAHEEGVVRPGEKVNRGQDAEHGCHEARFPAAGNPRQQDGEHEGQRAEQNLRGNRVPWVTARTAIMIPVPATAMMYAQPEYRRNSITEGPFQVGSKLRLMVPIVNSRGGLLSNIPGLLWSELGKPSIGAYKPVKRLVSKKSPVPPLRKSTEF